jgi:hypothetical protein
MALAISDSVGAGGANHAADVQNVRTALNFIPIRLGGPSPELPPTANIQAITNAITALQTAGSVPPPLVVGRVDPGGSTFSAINRLSEEPRDTALRFAPLARTLVQMALQAVTRIEATLVTPSATVSPTLIDALETHFHLNPGTVQSGSTHSGLTLAALRPIKQNYINLAAALARPRNFFINATDAQATFRDRNRRPFVARAFTRFQTSSAYNRDFKFIGRFAQVAIIIHETVHFIDSSAAGNNDFAEWDRPSYDLFMTAAQARHNPSSYGAFAFHVVNNVDIRPGDGNLLSGGVEGSSATPTLGTPPSF